MLTNNLLGDARSLKPHYFLGLLMGPESVARAHWPVAGACCFIALGNAHTASEAMCAAGFVAAVDLVSRPYGGGGTA